MPRNKTSLRVIPLGGLGEIGKNMMVLECGDDIVVIDAGLMFPDEDMLGVDLVIPNIAYLREHKAKIRGIVITHGHEDHIGALPYLLRDLPFPVYGTRLTMGLISVKLKEHKLLSQAKLHTIQAGQEFRLGQMRITPYAVNHSIPDAVGLIIRTPIGTVVHTGDFKIDHTPVDGKPFDLHTLARAGAEGVLLLLSDSTSAEVSGYTPSEMTVVETLDRIIREAPGRVIVASFASLIARIQIVLNAAARHGRRVVVVGRSMEDNVRMALDMGYLHDPSNVLMKHSEMRETPPEKTVVMTTGSQGEPTSALVRMAKGDQRLVRIVPGDTVIVSSNPIPGNEVVVGRTIDSLFKLGARVHYSRIEQVHVRGHASQEELKLIMQLTKPRFFVPVHGDYRHLVIHGQLAESLGIPRDRIFVRTDGDILELTADSGKVVGKVEADNVYVDGLRIGDIDSPVLRDREHLANDGIVVTILTLDRNTGRVLGRPDIITRGFMEEEASEELLEQSRKVILHSLDHGLGRPAEPGYIHGRVKESLAEFFYQKTKRRPMILPVAVEI
ncbi:MAG: ribonuclease J [Chloroflexi bacterium]|nr:ribonuclease J [Chloroflexota bacterium]